MPCSGVAHSVSRDGPQIASVQRPTALPVVRCIAFEKLLHLMLQQRDISMGQKIGRCDGAHLTTEFQASQGYTVRFCLKKQMEFIFKILIY